MIEYDEAGAMQSCNNVIWYHVDGFLKMNAIPSIIQ